MPVDLVACLPVIAFYLRIWRGLTDRESLNGLLFVSPFIVGFVLFQALPMVASLLLSLTDFDPREPDQISFIGIDNYANMLSDPILLHSLFVTARFALLVVPLTLFRHYLRRHHVPYLQGQVYIEPHPRELMLRNHV